MELNFCYVLMCDCLFRNATKVLLFYVRVTTDLFARLCICSCDNGFVCASMDLFARLRICTLVIFLFVSFQGAGDCFVGTLAFCITKKPELEFKEMIRRAVDIASISVSRPGTQTSYPTNNELPDNLK